MIHQLFFFFCLFCQRRIILIVDWNFLVFIGKILLIRGDCYHDLWKLICIESLWIIIVVIVTPSWPCWLFRISDTLCVVTILIWIMFKTYHDNLQMALLLFNNLFYFSIFSFSRYIIMQTLFNKSSRSIHNTSPSKFIHFTCLFVYFSLNKSK